MLRIENVTYRIGARVLLDQASAGINPGHRVGLVGRNGTGKTTLLRIITGELDTEAGGVEFPARWRVGITSQEAPHGSDSLIDTVLKADKELAALRAEAETAADPDRIAEIHARLVDKEAYTATARAARILAGLGFDEAAQQKPCSDYSGGWRMRVALAGLLFTQPDLLLLDEPTNHLDLEATIWLEDYLKHYPGTILLVSHDRDLLNRVPEEILHLENGKLTLYQGGYDRFEATRRMRLEQNEKLRAKQELKRAEIQKFINRFKAKASKAKQAQSRVKMLERMEPIAEHHEEGGIALDFPAPEELAPPLFSMDRVAVGYNGKPVLSQLSLRLDTDDRIALLGANGNGKSTLVKLLAGRLAPLSGEVVKSNKLRVGYFAQHQAEELDLEATPILEMSRRRPQDTLLQVRSQLGRFGFGQQRAETQIAKLSGGEKARLLFALMSAARPHMLLLDEPTNHLDIDSREALIQAINAFEGAVIVISHEPRFLELTVDRFLLVEGGKVTPFDGDMDDYRERLLSRDAERARKAEAPKPAPSEKKQDFRKAQVDRNQRKSLQKKLEQAEAQVGRLEAARAQLRDAMADPKLYEGPPAALRDIQHKLADLERGIEAAEAEWLELQARWDEAFADQPRRA